MAIYRVSQPGPRRQPRDGGRSRGERTASCMPLMVSNMPMPVSTGSGEKPSQLRPPSGCRPSGPAWLRQQHPTLPTHRGQTDGTYDGPEGDVDALAAELLAHGVAARIHQLAVPGHGCVEPGREGGRVGGGAHAQRRVLQTQRRKAQARDRACQLHISIGPSGKGEGGRKGGGRELWHEPTLPAQRSIIQPVPVVRLTFSISVSPSTKRRALA